MPVEVTLTEYDEGERLTVTHDKGSNYHVDSNGHLHVSGWDGAGATSLAGYVSGSWHKVVVG